MQALKKVRLQKAFLGNLRSYYSEKSNFDKVVPYLTKNELEFLFSYEEHKGIVYDRILIPLNLVDKGLLKETVSQLNPITKHYAIKCLTKDDLLKEANLKLLKEAEIVEDK